MRETSYVHLAAPDHRSTDAQDDCLRLSQPQELRMRSGDGRALVDKRSFCFVHTPAHWAIQIPIAAHRVKEILFTQPDPIFAEALDRNSSAPLGRTTSAHQNVCWHYGESRLGHWLLQGWNRICTVCPKDGMNDLRLTLVLKAVRNLQQRDTRSMRQHVERTRWLVFLTKKSKRSPFPLSIRD